MVLNQGDQAILNNNKALIVITVAHNKIIKIKILIFYNLNKININLQFIIVNLSMVDKGKIIINLKNKIINHHFIILFNQIIIMLKIIIINIIDFINYFYIYFLI